MAILPQLAGAARAHLQIPTQWQYSPPPHCRLTVLHSTAQYSTVQYSTVQTCLIAAARLWSPEGTPADSTLSDTLNNNTWRRRGYDCTAAVWSVECGPCEVVRSSAVSASSCPDQWLESAASTRKVIICTTELRSLLYEWPPPEAKSPNIFMIV